MLTFSFCLILASMLQNHRTIFPTPCYKSTEPFSLFYATIAQIFFPYSVLQKHRTIFHIPWKSTEQNSIFHNCKGFFSLTFLKRFDARKQGAAAKTTCTFWTLLRIIIKSLKLITKKKNSVCLLSSHY
jgi:hypothetical protein